MENNLDTYLQKLNEGFEQVNQSLKTKFKKIYTTRLHPDLVSEISVFCYGSDNQLKNLANIQLTNARTFQIKPYDPSILEDIEKAIRKSKPGFNPIIVNDLINISFPPPTEESRKKSAKEAKVFLEEEKVSLRNIRQKIIKNIKDDKLPQDAEKKFLNTLDQEIKKLNSLLEDLYKAKEKELMQI